MQLIWSIDHLWQNEGSVIFFCDTDFVTMATVVSSCNYVTCCSVKLKFNHLVSFTHFKSCSKNQDHMTSYGEVIYTSVVLPHKPRFQTEI